MSPREWFDWHVYGPPPPPPLEVAATGDGPTLTITGPGGSMAIDLLVRRPDREPVPCMIGLNFLGNDQTLGGGKRAHRWPYDAVNRRGWAVVTCCCGDGSGEATFRDQVARVSGATAPLGTIAAWAWALSRVMDWVQSRPDWFAPRRVAVLGHSRMGKAALVAAARDQRFAAAVSNGSGAGGAAMFGGRPADSGGEKLQDLLRFGHWFIPPLAEWAGRDEELPYDQDALLRLIAPRPVVVLSGQDDHWAQPEAERRAAELTGAAYHIRPGKHDLTPTDWTAALDALDKRLAG
jgi:hypothetical protein